MIFGGNFASSLQDLFKTSRTSKKLPKIHMSETKNAQKAEENQRLLFEDEVWTVRRLPARDDVLAARRPLRVGGTGKVVL